MCVCVSTLSKGHISAQQEGIYLQAEKIVLIINQTGQKLAQGHLSLQNCETICLCCLSPSVWYSVIADPWKGGTQATHVDTMRASREPGLGSWPANQEWNRPGFKSQTHPLLLSDFGNFLNYLSLEFLHLNSGVRIMSIPGVPGRLSKMIHKKHPGVSI